MLLLGACSITPNRRRSRCMTSCVNGLRTFEDDSWSSRLRVRNVWTIRSLLGWCPSSTSQPIIKNAVQIIHLTMSPAQVEGIWKALSECGSDYKVEGAPKTKVLDIGAMQWTISLATGTGQSLFALVRTLLTIL